MKKLKPKTIKLTEPIEIDWTLWNERHGYPLSEKKKQEFIKYLENENDEITSEN